MKKGSFKDRILEYGKKLLLREKEKYACGRKNSYFEYENEFNDLLFSLSSARDMQFENSRLKVKIRDLEDRLYGRGK